MTQAAKVQRGHANPATIVAVSKRRHSMAIPDEFLPQLEAAGLVLDDQDHNVIAYREGHKAGHLWGPTVDGHWFVYRTDKKAATRVSTRDDGVRYLLGYDVPVAVA